MSAPARRPLRVALVWDQFGAYHVDRCEAVARRLGDAAELHAIELATASDTYAWEASGAVAGCVKRTLFPGRNIDTVGRGTLFRRQVAALRGMDAVFLGTGYARPDQFAVAALLRLSGVRVVMMNDSKFDDFPRRLPFELLKPFAMLPYSAALVAGDRHEAYLRFLGFGKRPIRQGYDTVSIERLRAAAAGVAPDHGARPFVFVGRFVPKKDVGFLLDGYAHYRALAGEGAHRLVLIGAGPLETEIGARIAALGLGAAVDLPGFLSAPEVARTLAGGLALVLPSSEEQWGLVVNEAMAVGIPAIVTEAVGARDHLVRNFVDGFVVEQGSVEGLARAMLALAGSREEWSRMAANAAAAAPKGDAARFADAVADLLPRSRSAAA